MNVQEIRDAVRAQMDIEEDDLSNTLLDLYLREAYQQTLSIEPRWPFLQTAWSVSATADGAPITVPTDFATAAAVVETQARAYALDHIGHEDAEIHFAADDTGGRPEMFSLWGGQLHLWPMSDEVRAYTLRGWRLGDESWVGVAAGVPDMDARLHTSLIHYAVARAYSQQEDEVLSRESMRTWALTVEQARKSIMHPTYQGRAYVGRGMRRRPWTRRIPSGLVVA